MAAGVPCKPTACVLYQCVFCVAGAQATVTRTSACIPPIAPVAHWFVTVTAIKALSASLPLYPRYCIIVNHTVLTVDELHLIYLTTVFSPV